MSEYFKNSGIIGKNYSGNVAGMYTTNRRRLISYDVVKSGLLLHLDAGNTASYPGTGTTWSDLSGNNRNATIVGSPVFNTNYFTISSDATYMSVPTAGLSPGTGDFTYSTWVMFNAFDTLDTIFELGSWTDSMLLRYESNNGGFRVYAEGVSPVGTFTWSGSTGVWYNIVFLRQSNTASLYINNVLTGTPFTMNINVSITNATMIIMRSQHAGAQWTSGRISTFSVYDRALTAAEIQQNYSALSFRYI